jgi:arylsulfatase A-like enzyme
MRSQKSIVLVTVDCLRADHVGFMGYDRPTTRFLDSLAGESFVVPAAIVAGAPTYYSFPAILASRYPLALGRDVLGLAPDEPSLAPLLKSAGYATASFDAANPYISSRFGYQQGFDTFRDFLEEEPIPLSEEKTSAAPDGGFAARLNRRLHAARSAMGPFRSVYDEMYFRYCQRVTPVAPSLDALRRFPAADVIVDHALDWLASVGDKPFFLWLHLMDPHAPYYPKEDALALMKSGAVTPSRARYLNSFWNRSDIGPPRLVRHRDDIIALYDAGIRWVDTQMGRLVAALRSAQQWENCIFALTADHGEEFLDHGGRYHPPSRLTEELIHVPFLLRVPGSSKKKVGKSPFSMMHLAPTLLDAADLAVPAEFQGRSHWDDLRQGRTFDGEAISECVAGCTNPFRPENRLGSRVLSVRGARFKLTLQFDPPTEQLYDLEADPGEHAPLAPTAKQPVRRYLLEVSGEHLRNSRAKRDEQLRARARLRDLRLEWTRSFPRRSEI